MVFSYCPQDNRRHASEVPWHFKSMRRESEAFLGQRPP